VRAVQLGTVARACRDGYTMTDDVLIKAAPFMTQCGPCDFGLVEYGCQCPTEDFRPVVAELCREVERLRAIEARVRAEERENVAADLRARANRIRSQIDGSYSAAEREVVLRDAANWENAARSPCWVFSRHHTGAEAMIDIEQLKHDLDEAIALRHPQRTMRVTLECGHLRLLPWSSTVLGIGASTLCRLCADADRLVVNVEETGVLLFTPEGS